MIIKDYQFKNNAIIHGQDLPEHTLSREDEMRLGKIIQSADEDSFEYKEAFDLMVNNNLRLVAKIALEHSERCQTDCSELMDEGFIGLVKAVKNFDPENNKETSFATYARLWIKREIIEFSFENSTIKIPMGIGARISPYKRMIENGYSEEKIKEKLNIKHGEIELIKNSFFSMIDIDRNIESESGRATSLHDIIVDESSNVVDNSVKTSKKQIILKMLAFLNNEEIDLITSYYLKDSPNTLDELGKQYGKSRERIRQKLNIAIYRLKRKLVEVKFDQ